MLECARCPQQVLLCVAGTSPCLLLFCLWRTLEREIPKIVFYREGSPGNFTKEEERMVKGLDSERDHEVHTPSAMQNHRVLLKSTAMCVFPNNQTLFFQHLPVQHVFGIWPR